MTNRGATDLGMCANSIERTRETLFDVVGVPGHGQPVVPEILSKDKRLLSQPSLSPRDMAASARGITPDGQQPRGQI